MIPFVALQLYEDRSDGDVGAFSKENLQIFLICSLGAWILTTALFFYSIDFSYISTFSGLMTGSEYTCDRFHYAKDDQSKFAAAYENRANYTKPIHGEIKTWVANNIVRWKIEDESWFRIDLVPDEMLPSDDLEAECGSLERRKVHPEKTS